MAKANPSVGPNPIVKATRLARALSERAQIYSNSLIMLLPQQRDFTSAGAAVVRFLQPAERVAAAAAVRVRPFAFTHLLYMLLCFFLLYELSCRDFEVSVPYTWYIHTKTKVVCTIFVLLQSNAVDATVLLPLLL